MGWFFIFDFFSRNFSLAKDRVEGLVNWKICTHNNLTLFIYEFRPSVSISGNANKPIVQADAAANVSHLLHEIRSNVYSIKERLTAQRKRFDEIYSELNIVKIMLKTSQLDSDADEKVDVVPAKSEKELK